MRKSTLGIIISLISLSAIVVIVVSTRPKTAVQTKSTERQISLTDVAKHASTDDCWMIINQSVYDVTEYVYNHPGGSEIARGCGKDATALFTQRRDGNERIGSGTPHSSSASATLESFKIGSLVN